jgi:Flp pilus assembly protein TadD
VTLASAADLPPTRPKSAPAVPAAAAKPAPADTSDLREACQAALRRERAKPALAACEKAALANPASADVLVLLAHANLLAGWEGETLRLARRASFLDPKCADAYLLIGTVQQAAGRKSDARGAYEDYLRLAPRGAHAAEVRAILKTL